MSGKSFAIFFGGMAIVIACMYRADHLAILAEQRASLLQIEVNVLQDQLTDTIDQVSQRPTYADGVRDGFNGSKDEGYRNGYHAGLAQTLEQAKTSEALSKSED